MRLLESARRDTDAYTTSVTLRTGYGERTPERHRFEPFSRRLRDPHPGGSDWGFGVLRNQGASKRSRTPGGPPDAPWGPQVTSEDSVHPQTRGWSGRTCLGRTSLGGIGPVSGRGVGQGRGVGHQLGGGKSPRLETHRPQSHSSRSSVHDGQTLEFRSRSDNLRVGDFRAPGSRYGLGRVPGGSGREVALNPDFLLFPEGDRNDRGNSPRRLSPPRRVGWAWFRRPFHLEGRTGTAVHLSVRGLWPQGHRVGRFSTLGLVDLRVGDLGHDAPDFCRLPRDAGGGPPFPLDAAAATRHPNPRRTT